MRAGLIFTLQAVLVIAAMSSLPELAAAGSCTCQCAAAYPHGSETLTINLPSGYSCSQATGRSCTVANTDTRDPASRAGTPRVSGTTRSCSGPDDELFRYRR
jgi:hypothetical protein